MKADHVRVGHRGRVLLFFGCLDVVIAASLLVPGRTAASVPMYVWLAEVMPLWIWALIWGFVGMICLWQAFRKRDALGYTAATGLKLWWGLVCLGGWIFGGIERGYVQAAIWLGLAYLMAKVLAPWPEPGDGRGPTWKQQP